MSHAVAADELSALALWGTETDDGTTGRMPPAHDGRNPRDVIEAIGRALPSASTVQRAQLWHRLGYLAVMLGDVRTKGIESFEHMLRAATDAGDRRLEGLAHVGMSAALDFVGRRHEALEHATRAEAVAGELGDRRMLALALNARAQYLKENGENEAAHELFEKVRGLAVELDDDRLRAAAEIGFGRTTSMTDAAQAIAHYDRAIELAREHGDEASLMVAYNNQSDWFINTGRCDEAIALREESMRIARRLGARPAAGRAMIGIAKALTLTGRLDEARAMLDRGFPATVATGDLEGDLHSSLNLAYLYVQAGDVARATELYRQTLERSLAAPDHACAVFAQEALDMLAGGETPAPGIVLSAGRELSDDELETVVGGGRSGGYTYPTGDQSWNP